jgi:hypothetical protein
VKAVVAVADIRDIDVPDEFVPTITEKHLPFVSLFRARVR